MVNFETDELKIKEAADKGIITSADYANWKGIQGYSSMLRKSQESGDITKDVCEKEIAKTGAAHWVRDLSANTLRFTLRGVDEFQPIDLFKQKEILKSMKQQPLQTDYIKTQRVDDSTRRMIKAVDNICQLAEDYKRKQKK